MNGFFHCMVFFDMSRHTSQAAINSIAKVAFEEVSVTVERNVSGKVRNKHNWDNKLVLAKGAG